LTFQAPATDRWPAAAGVTSMLRRAIGDSAGGASLAIAALDVERATDRPARFEPAFALFCCSGRRDDVQAKRILPQVERVAETTGDPIELANARYVRTITDIDSGAEAVHDYAQHAVVDAEASGNAVQLAYAYAGLLAVLSRHDRTAALELLDKVRRWAAVADIRSIADNAALWLAAAPDGGSTDALRFSRDALIGSVTGGYVGNLNASLSSVLLPLIDCRRHRCAAVLLGGLSVLPPSNVIRRDQLARATTELAQVLGDEFARLVDHGAHVNKRELARLAVDEIDLVLNRETEGDTSDATR
jgi:hypothetical protein